MRQDIYPSAPLDWAQAKTLKQFCEQNNLPVEHEQTLANMTGRGYRPPTTSEGWQAVYDLLKRIIFDE